MLGDKEPSRDLSSDVVVHESGDVSQSATGSGLLAVQLLPCATVFDTCCRGPTSMSGGATHGITPALTWQVS
ncbi:hypothetical protein [Myxococcus stipitatus]|uniref:hypothetical protein n=1 Tax=Myxococcus stipitatus TaxID=83455 RepID=UPI0005C66264|nr:hypothetical protein [Myxococcus stipitatus]